MLQLPILYAGVQHISAAHADLVGDLQKFFLGLEYRIVVDEYFGEGTEATVKEYQRAKGVQDDGIVGPKTWGHLLADGFLPKEFTVDRFAYKEDPNFPAKPPGAFSPNGLLLFGKDFQYQAKPLPSMPEYVVADRKWVNANIGIADIPQLIGVRGAPVDGLIFFHKRLIKQLEALFTVWENLGKIHLVETFSGSWVTRFVRGRTDRLSNHSFGSAFDINAEWNGYRRQPALVGRRGSVRELVMPAYELGFYWGGWYNDGMHFECYQEMGPYEIGVAVEKIMEKAV